MTAKQLWCGAALLALGASMAAGCSDDSTGSSSTTSAGNDDGGSGVDSAAAGSASQSRSGQPSGGADAGASTGGSSLDGGASNCPAGPPGKRPADYLAEFASGSRLEAHYFTADGLHSLFARFFDTKLGEYCDFMLASDNQLRCLPRSVAVAIGEGSADAACKKPLWGLSAACDGKTAYARQELACPGQAEVYETAAYTGVRYSGAPGTCQSSQEAALPHSQTLGAKLLPDAFVAGKLVELPGVCQASLRVVEAEDGARGPVEVFDIGTGAGCMPLSPACFPQRQAFTIPGLYTDADCKTLTTEKYAAWGADASCALPDFVSDGSTDQLVYLPGPVTETPLYSKIGGCKPARENEWSRTLLGFGEVVPLAQLAQLERGLFGDGRLQVNMISEAGHPLLPALDGNTRFHDAVLDQDCWLVPLADGSWRCIPSQWRGSGFLDEYGDSKCTQPVRRCQEDPCVDQIVFDEQPAADGCDSRHVVTGIWRFTAQAKGYYRKDETHACASGGEAQNDMWLVEAVEPESLAEAQLGTAQRR